MDRRAFLGMMAGGLLAAPLAVEAQRARVYRIGFISSASSAAMAARDEAFRQGLRALGYVVGQNITIEYRWADGKSERLPGFAAELVNLKLDVIVTHGVVAGVGPLEEYLGIIQAGMLKKASKAPPVSPAGSTTHARRPRRYCSTTRSPQ